MGPNRRSRRAFTVGAIIALLVISGLASSVVVTSQPTGPDALEDDQAAEPPGLTQHAERDENATVAVVDSGIDDRHPDLQGRVVDRIDFTGEEPTHPETGTDEGRHGTYIAGAVAGSGAASDGEYAGVAPNASLVDVRIMEESGYGSADAATIDSAIEYAVEEADADVILLSLNSIGADPEVIESRVEWAIDHGVVVVASAGNDGQLRSITTPGTTPGAITVGASDGNGRLLNRSARGPTADGAFKPELVAPGERITVPRAGYTGTGDSGQAYARVTGTSIAAATVAGAGARLLEADPGLSPAAIERRLTSTARPIKSAAAGTNRTSGHVFGSGSGVLDIERALDPDVMSNGVVDLGVVTDNEPVTRTIALENTDDQRHDLAFETTLHNVDTEADASESLTVNRSELSLAPGERAKVKLTIAGVSAGAHAGEMQYSIGGEPRSIALGFVRGGTVTVEKRSLSASDRVDGDALLVFTENDTHSEALEFESGTASFLAGGGTYVLWSAGVDEPTGSLVFVSKRITVDGPTRVVLDERETVPAGIDAGPLVEAYGPLGNRSVTASMRTAKGDGTERLTRGLRDADSRTVRVSRDRKTSFVTTYLLTSEATTPGAIDVFHVSHRIRSTKWARSRTVRPADLATTEYRLGRTTADLFPEIQERVRVTGALDSRQLSWFQFGGQPIQRVHRTENVIHERHLRMDGWRAALDPAGGKTVTALAQPFFARVGVTIDKIDREAGADRTATVEARPFADGAGTKLYTGETHTLSVAVDGEPVETQQSGEAVLTTEELRFDANESLSIRLEGENPEGRLSTRTKTTVTVDDPDGAVPQPRNIAVEGMTLTGAAGPGRTTVRIAVEPRNAITDPKVWYARGDPGTAPWTDETAWQRAPAGRGYEGVRATLDVPEDAETISLAAAVETPGGNTVRTMTANAFHVGSAPNTSTRDIEGTLQLAGGKPARNDTVIAAPIDDGSPSVTRTDSKGRFVLEVPKDRRYDLQYRRGDLWGTDQRADRRPDFYSLGRVTTDADVAVKRTLPAATRTNITVIDERGTGVGNATVRLTHADGNASATATLTTASNGTVALGGTAGVRLAGTVNITVIAPDEPAFLNATERRTVMLNGTSTTEPFVLETEPPTAAITVSRTAMLRGTFTTLDASESDVPAGPAEYHWDLDGDGTIDRVTDEPRLRHTPAVGVSTPSVTVVDGAGKTDRVSAPSIRVIARGG